MDIDEDFGSICRLCGTKSPDLIDLFEVFDSGRNLIATIKKYIRVTVSNLILYIASTVMKNRSWVHK